MKIEHIKADLKQLLTERRQSVSAFAQEVGIPQPTLSKFLNGKTGLNASTVLRLIPAIYGDIFNRQNYSASTPTEKEQ